MEDLKQKSDICQLTKDLGLIRYEDSDGLWLAVADKSENIYSALLIDDDCSEFAALTMLLDLNKKRIQKDNENYPGLYKDIFLRMLELAKTTSEYKSINEGEKENEK